ncbi:hypothetical protein AB0L86_28545 [Micromonospora musae]|uniref:hypothetical protein n=1 Tax=Micromonospora musae TaxID=1894970 RepID=UPI003419C146
MPDHTPRRSRLSGLWACFVGGALLALLLAILDPITRREDCPNYGGNGNASSYANPAWDLYLPLLLLGWMVLIVVEQALPITRRNRDRFDVATRAAAAVGISLVSSCCFILPIQIVCR